MCWQPTEFIRFIQTIKTSSFPAKINTNKGNGYLKAINNPEGKHILVCDWIGTHLARLIGLPTLEPAIITITDLDHIPLRGNSTVEPGPSFITREELGISVGEQRSLDNIENIQDIPLIIVFDTWVRNCDRYQPNYRSNGTARENADNLFLSMVGATKGKFILKPIDHGNIFTCGRSLTRQISNINDIQDRQIYGLFPFLQKHVTIEQIDLSVRILGEISSSTWASVLDSIPEAWEVSIEVRDAIDRFLRQRASFLVHNMHNMFEEYIGQIMR